MKLALSGGKIITPFRVIDDGTILVEKGKIAGLGKSSELTPYIK